VPRRGADDVLARLAEQVGARLTSSTIFGTPVERDGVTVVPVGTVRFGFGGGGGSDASGKGEGEGGGALGSGGPAGYIELKDGRSRFVPIVHPGRMLALICATLVGGLLIAEVGRARSNRTAPGHREDRRIAGGSRRRRRARERAH
jgi:uncharacterized spore protein YtfJ